MKRSWLCAGLLVALVGSCAASWMQFKSLPTDGSQPETVTGLLRFPHDGGRAPAVILLADCDGIGAHERRWGRDVTEAGFVSYVIDGHFSRQVDDGCASPLSHETRIADALGAIAKLAEHDQVDGDRIAILGWGLGGDAALDIVSSTELLPGTYSGSGCGGVLSDLRTRRPGAPAGNPGVARALSRRRPVPRLCGGSGCRRRGVRSCRRAWRCRRGFRLPSLRRGLSGRPGDL